MESKAEKNIDVVCVGHALMDMLVEVDDSFLMENNLQKGIMTLISEVEAEKHLSSIADKEVRSLPGGSAANTARGISALGGSATFFGSVGASMYGNMYRDVLGEAGVEVYLHDGSELTGMAISYITPDHERTFATHLGAASDVPWTVIDTKVLASAKVAHMEAYQFEGKTKDTLLQVMEFAKKNEVLVSLDLNDAELINRNHNLFKEVVIGYVDILFANETEGFAFTGCSEILEVIEKLKGVAKIVILKCGADGAYIIHDGEVISIAAAPAEVVDTTGAGDLFAAGFLFGLTHGYDLAEAGALGSKIAATIIARVGVDTSVINGEEFLSKE